MEGSKWIVDVIKSYCKTKEEIIMAFLFGSYAFGTTCLESDVDIAVYMKNVDENKENEIQNELELLLGKEVDLVNMSRAPATLAWNILRKGIPIAIKERGIYMDFMLEVSAEAQDFLDFNIDTWRRKYGIRTS